MSNLQRLSTKESDQSIYDENNSSVLQQKLQLYKSSVIRNNEFIVRLIQYYEHGSKVDLSYQNLTDADMGTIVEHAIHDKQCEGLNLWGNRFTHKSIGLLADELNENQTIKELDLSYNPLTDDGIRVLCRVLSLNNCVLEDLDLSSTNITDRGAKYLANMLKRNNRLKVLVLNKNDISDNGFKLLLDGLARDNRTLKQLKLEDNQFITIEGVDYLLGSLKENRILKDLYLKGCSVSIQDLETVQRKLAEASSLECFVII